MKTLLLMVPLLLLATAAMGQISGSSHDFSGATTWNANGEICQPCHTPHGAITTVTNAPLWNHSLSAVTNYTLYTGYDIQGTVTQPSSSTKLCLSCHDGTVALDSYGGASNPTTVTLTGSANLGSDLSDDHPVSIDYDNTSDPGLWATTHTVSGTITVADLLVTVGTTDYVECSSCHDPHDDTNGHLLRVSNTSSTLCLGCHNK